MLDLDKLEERLIPSLTDDQERTISIIYVISATLSISGSFIIISRVLRNQKFSKPYDRIMLGLSFFDIIASISYLLTPFLLPKETSTRVWARGNDVSCSLLGWLTQLGYAAIFYNAVLSYYFLAVVRFSISPGDFVSRFEPYLTALPVFYFLFTATIGVPFHLFSELRLGLGCWVAAFPKGCEETGNCISNYIGWVFVGVPFLFTFLSLVINNIAIIVYVRRSLRVGNNNYTKSQRNQIRQVTTQGFLYVGAFFLCYLPAFWVRILGTQGHRLSTEADVYGILLLQAILLPLQGFFNMIIYIRPVFIRLKGVGASNGVALRGALFEPDISKLLSEVQSTTFRHIRSSGDNISNEDGLNSENEVENSMVRGDSNNMVGEVSIADASTVDFCSESCDLKRNTVSFQGLLPAQHPSKSIRISNPMAINMDGSLRMVSA